MTIIRPGHLGLSLSSEKTPRFHLQRKEISIVTRACTCCVTYLTNGLALLPGSSPYSYCLAMSDRGLRDLRSLDKVLQQSIVCAIARTRKLERRDYKEWLSVKDNTWRLPYLIMPLKDIQWQNVTRPTRLQYIFEHVTIPIQYVHILQPLGNSVVVKV